MRAHFVPDERDHGRLQPALLDQIPHCAAHRAFTKTLLPRCRLMELSLLLNEGMTESRELVL